MNEILGDATLYPNKVKFESKLVSLYRSVTRSFRVLPDFLIIGGQKCGTFSLFKYLTSHPDIHTLSNRDIYFFDVNSNYEKGIAFYKQFFPTYLQKFFVTKIKKSKFLTGEATPTYIFHPHVPNRIHSIIPRVKIIALLRNPIHRAYSHFQMSSRRGREIKNFAEAIKYEKGHYSGEMQKMIDDANYYSFEYRNKSYLERGIYVDQLKRWFDVFPKEQILVLKSEDLFEDPQKTYSQTLEFLGLKDHTLSEFKKFNAGKYADLDEKLYSELSEYYKPHNERLYKFLGRDFNWN